MRTLLVLAPLCALASANVAAANQRFPYEASIEAPEVYVRSGPGQRFYATSRLTTGDRVIVHRHDPGGWYMIAPPPGSFSWVRADYVQCTDARNGVVTENNVVVRVGSAYGDVRDVEQRRLNKGDRVTILAQETLRDERGEVRMFKIAPPAGEYRWVSGRYAAPCGPDGQIVRTHDPYKAPPGITDPAYVPDTPDVVAHEPPVPDPIDGFEERPIVRDPPVNSVPVAGPSAGEMARDKERLHTIDVAFRDMVQLDPTQWNLATLLRRYEDLGNDTRTPAVKGAIPTRIAAIKRYGRIRAEYVDFVRLTTGTANRDAELVSLQKQSVHTLPAPATSPEVPPAPGVPATPASTTETVTLCGAGIVQRTATPMPGGPTHVLVAPNGRILAHLVPAELGVDLDAWLGRQAGAIGTRAYEAALQGDLIEVRELVPVKLSP